MTHILDILEEAWRRGASDVHLTVEYPPVFRIDGDLVVTGSASLKPSDTLGFFESLTEGNERVREEFVRDGDADFAYSVHGLGRFRVNAYRQRGTVAIAIRLIPSRVPSVEELGLPEKIVDFARETDGLVIVTGPTGSGKSTTLAALIDLINRERKCHIITLEDPIEYLHKHGVSIVNQREVGGDTASFSKGLRAALRQDPDVILVGEMRDLETIEVTLRAAETGHLVLTTLHTPNAPQSVDRIIDVFPPHQQEQVKVQLAGTLVGIVAQRLLPRIDVGGRIAAFEILVATPAVRNLIREGKSYQLASVIQTGARFGMRTMESSIAELVESAKVSPEWLKEYASTRRAPGDRFS